MDFMKRNYLFFLIFLFSLYNCFSVEYNNVEFSVPVIEEKKNIHKLFFYNGRPYVFAKVYFTENDFVEGYFLLDTGYPKSVLFLNYFQKFLKKEKFETIEANNCEYVKCDIFMDTMTIKNLTITIENYLSKDFFRNINQKNIGIIGSDILFSKSFYLSLTEQEFGWIDDIKLLENAKKIELIPFYQKNAAPLYQVEIEDKFFKSSQKYSEFLSDDKSKSKYFVDTGSYFIFTSSFSDFYEIVKNKQLDFIMYKNYANPYGISFINKATFFEQSLNNIFFAGGNFGTGKLKVIGCQILGAFNLFFEKQNNQIKYLYLVPVERKKYERFRKDNDNMQFFSVNTYGFLADNFGVVTHKAHFQGKEIAPNIKIGDKILQMNNLSFEDVAEWTLPENVKIQILRKNEILKLNIKRKKMEYENEK
jgi:hypothetical protein